ncbi:MAG: hypothetical protein VR72_16425 [Clostridiaceae bacterium BRH_c20a]|nr:MAG: hypothetical protein VR72_16425 [Clostridiaceae bacterium BRH_c20a]
MEGLKFIDTPALILDKAVLLKNIQEMSALANKAGVKLRPHIKAHKCSKISNLQIANGASGITVAKVSEAEVMFSAGIKDILIAYQLINTEKINRVISLIKKGASISCLLDNLCQTKKLNNAAKENNLIIDTYVEVDSGLKRTGLEPEDVVGFVNELKSFDGLRFKGILTHAGQVYGALKVNVPAIGHQEGMIMEKVAKSLENAGFVDFEVSVGATPTVKYSAYNPKVTEIRPGNYVFNDAIQVGLGTAERDRCSLKVLTTVISKPAPDRIIIDAGSKTLALDKGAHGTEVVTGFGIVNGYPNLILERLSEEHGVIKVSSAGKVPAIGDKILIIPNHACPVANLAEELILIEHGKENESWVIDARGKNK